MKQKIAIKVSMKEGTKYRSKALKIVASVSGNIETIGLVGDNKDKLEIVGDLDPIKLIKVLRKKFSYAQLESVSIVEVKDKDKDKDEDKNEPEITWTCSCGVPHQTPYSHCYLSPYPTYGIW